MAEDKRLSAVEYVDRFFDEIRAEVRTNPRLAERLVSALGGSVTFAEEQKAEVANPYLAAARLSKPEFIATFASLKPGQLRQVLKDHNLATRIDMTGKSAEQLLEMMHERAARRIKERQSSLF
jgi:hypothetical protein